RICFRSRSDVRILEHTRALCKAASGRSYCWPRGRDGRFTWVHAIGGQSRNLAGSVIATER
ncbi:MAG TPA: hypothetical protein VKD66_01565, partial [Streptosporangiaceae bacterium]|nr:hypothetical protein [Streptosporangiaceae bacterium]